MASSILSPYAPVTISISFVHAMLSGRTDNWPPIADVLDEAGIAEELLRHPGARITAGQYVALFRGLCDRLDDELLGLLSRPFKRGSYALMAQSALGAQNLQQAIPRIANTLRLLQDDMTLHLLADKQLAGLALRFSDSSRARHGFVPEIMLRSLWRLLDWLMGGNMSIARFDFACATPPDTKSYSEYFHAPLAFERPLSAFWFDAKQLQALVRVDENALPDFLSDPQTKFILPKRSNDEISAKVRCHLHQSRPAWPDLDATAAVLCMSSASLQRNLAKEGTSFKSLKDKLRRDMAITYLNTTTMSLTELADILGFSESAVFQRAFKSWTGIAPGSFRRGEKGDG
ncbi:MAG: AraC family transcriptional regulator [Pseudomonadota bacterium]